MPKGRRWPDKHCHTTAFGDLVYLSRLSARLWEARWHASPREPFTQDSHRACVATAEKLSAQSHEPEYLTICPGPYPGPTRCPDTPPEGWKAASR